MVKSYRVKERSFINGRLCEVGAIVQLHIDSPGTNLEEVRDGSPGTAEVSSSNSTTNAPATYIAVHQGGGRWAVKDANGKMDDWRGSKAEAEEKAKALNTPDPDQGDEPNPNLPDA